MLRTHMIHFWFFLTLLYLSGASVWQAAAQSSDKLGIHILHPDELTAANALLDANTTTESWHYVTIPFTYSDLEKPAEWKIFFSKARQLHIIPIIRLATKHEGDAWVQPDKKHIVEQLDFLSAQTWPTQEKRIIVYNEVNHAKEWGGQIDPQSYADTLEFVSSWAHTQPGDPFKVLPAAMDLAAGNTRDTKEAFAYLNAMVVHNPQIFDFVDAWNSHSYPNPGFAASPQRTGQNSISGFRHELAFLEKLSDRVWQVYITETGWSVTKSLAKWLPSYYQYAIDHVWSDPEVVAVTPFVLRGAPGPFEAFSFLDADGQPTAQYRAMFDQLSPI